MIRRMILALWILIITQITMGCSNLLPTVEQVTVSSWNSYGEVQQSFDKITLGKTTTEELKELGFDPFANPNIKLLNYLELTRIFIPNNSIRLTDLHSDIQTCLKVKTACQGYEVSPKFVNAERYGNAALDVLNFRRKTRTTGWKFQGLIILNENLVVYKLQSGQPNILELEDNKNPLGPLQSITLTPDLSI